jgi:glycosyltransferase involved in cell wall biosynthesis
MPAYNEEKRIGKTLEAYSSYFEDLRKNEKMDYDILVVINNTTDKTEEIVKKIAEANKRITYLNLRPGGKGFAVIEGFKDALKRKNDLIGFVDADMATLPEDFYDLVRRMGKSGGAIASRYIRGAVINPKPTKQRMIAKKVFNLLVRTMLFLPYRDTQCGAKVFRREVLENVLPALTMSQWAFDVDLIYSTKKKGFSVKEIPTKWSDKSYATINFWQAGPLMALGIIRLRLLNSPAKMFIRIYDKLIKNVWGMK